MLLLLTSLMMLCEPQGVAGTADAGEASSPTVSPESRELASPQTVFFLHSSGVFVFRFVPELDGRPFDEAWKQSIQRQFDLGDQDGDGRWSARELDELPVKVRTRLSASPTEIRNADENPRDGHIAATELIALLSRAGSGPFQVSIPGAGEAARGRPGERLFELLDVDSSRSLSADELSGALQPRFDLDDDGTYGVQELLVGSGRVLGRVPTRATTAAFLSATQPARVAQEILARYSGSTSDSRAATVPVASLGLPEAVGHEADADGSGDLDYDELRQFVRRPPISVTLQVKLGESVEQRVEVIHQSDPRLQVRGEAGVESVAVGDVQIEMRVAGFSPTAFTEYYRAQFARADRDANQYLDATEAEMSLLARQFADLDTDGDGRVFAAELDRMLEDSLKDARVRTRLSVTEYGRNLFTIIDRNADGLISPPELKATGRRIGLWDTSGDGSVRRNEVPQTFELTFGRGVPRLLDASNTFLRQGNETDSPKRQQHPEWFARMDRNGDGFVSRREFPGREGGFRSVDRDGDGYIDGPEAAMITRSAPASRKSKTDD